MIGTWARRALEGPVTNIGQLSPADTRELERMVKRGDLAKGEGGMFPAPKTVYAPPGYDFAGERERALDEFRAIARMEGRLSCR